MIERLLITLLATLGPAATVPLTPAPAPPAVGAARSTPVDSLNPFRELSYPPGRTYV